LLTTQEHVEPLLSYFPFLSPPQHDVLHYVSSDKYNSSCRKSSYISE
jgi:hypothetical protein